MQSIKYSISITKEKLGVGTNMENWYYGITIIKISSGEFKVAIERSFTLPETATINLEILISRIERMAKDDIIELIKHQNLYKTPLGEENYWYDNFGIQ